MKKDLFKKLQRKFNFIKKKNFRVPNDRIRRKNEKAKKNFTSAYTNQIKIGKIRKNKNL